jgi:hypothetical protein
MHYTFMFFSKLTSKKKVIPVIPVFEAYPEKFCFHGNNSVFLNSGQKRGGKHSFVTHPPFTLLSTPISPLYPSSYVYHVHYV